MDILTRLGEAFTWQDLAAGCDKIAMRELVVQVASPRMLYRMKKDTVRLQDRADAARIREAFDLEEELMSVRKYRSVADMPGVRPLPRLDPENLRIACELTELAFELRPWKFEPGVRKFRTQSEADQHRQEWEKQQVRPPFGSPP